MENANSRFVISLDFELHWGVFDTLEDRYNANLNGVEKAIKSILELFKTYNISATWATVGLLFNENIEDYRAYKPSKLPTYSNSKVNAYKVKIGRNQSVDSYHYAYDIIKSILSYPNQEIGCHSYSHYYAKESGQTIEQFDDDTKSAVKIAKDKFNIELKSYVFAKNEINNEYLYILEKYGFINYRTTPSSWLYIKGQQTNIIGKTIRVLDSYINIAGNYCSSYSGSAKLNKTEGNRFLRAHKNGLLSNLLVKRVKNEIEYAAKNRKDYHLWWHPHNFGTHLNENLENLEKILKYYLKCKKKYGMQSVCIKNL